MRLSLLPSIFVLGLAAIIALGLALNRPSPPGDPDWRYDRKQY